MLNNIRNFSKTWNTPKYLQVSDNYSFCFWGMGGVFSGGNTNNIAKINNYKYFNTRFYDHLNSIQDQIYNTIKENIDNNIIEEILGEFDFKKHVNSMEIEDLNINISDKILIKKN